MAWVAFLGGLALLLVGAEFFVRGSARLAAALGVPALVIGLTVVAFGTSAPEAAVGVQSVLHGQADIGLGNVIGSNIANVLLILGLASLISPLPVSTRVVRVDVPVMVGFSLLLWALCLDGEIGRGNGLSLLALAVIYNIWLVTSARRDAARLGSMSRPRGRPVSSSLFVVAGLMGIIVGAGWLVDGAVRLAHSFGLSELVIGLTVVAVGTSMPEIATSVVAGLRGQQDIAIGNAVGSNVFNILMVVGLTATLSPRPIPVNPAVLSFDLPIMVVVAVACLPIFFSGYRLARWEGLLFLFYYVAYTAYLVLRANEHAGLEGFSLVMSYFVVPLTAVTLIVLAYRSWRRGFPGSHRA
jgi:cation:H+ antiporter